MADTTTEILTYAGVHLNTFAKNVESIGGRLTIPGKRTGNVTIAGKEGQLAVLDKRYDQNVIALTMWLRGCDDDGGIPSGNARIEFFKRLDELARLFQLPGLQPLVWTLPDGTQRQADVEVLDTIDFTTIGYSPMAKFAVSLTVPDAFWKDVATRTDIFVNPTLGPVHPLTNLAGGSAPIDDAIITVTGPWTDFLITDFVSGSEFLFASTPPIGTTLAGGDILVIDCGKWTCLKNGVSWLTPIFHTSHSFLRLQPSASAGMAVTFFGTGLSGASSVNITARRRWLNG